MAKETMDPTELLLRQAMSALEAAMTFTDLRHPTPHDVETVKEECWTARDAISNALNP